MDSASSSEHDSETKCNDKNDKPAVNIVNEMDCDNEVKFDSDFQRNANKADSELESVNKLNLAENLDSNNPDSLDCLEIKTPFGKSSESSTNSEEMDLKILEEFDAEDEESNTNIFVGTCRLEQSKIFNELECEQLDHEKIKEEKHFRSEEEKLVYEILQNKKSNSQKQTELSVRPKTERQELSEEEAKHETDRENESKEIKFVDEDEFEDQPKNPSNPSIRVDEDNDEISDELKMIPSAKSSSKSSLGTFFHQKLFRSPSGSSSSSAPLTGSNSCHSSPETKCVTTDRNRLTVVTTDRNRNRTELIDNR